MTGMERQQPLTIRNPTGECTDWVADAPCISAAIKNPAAHRKVEASGPEQRRKQFFRDNIRRIVVSSIAPWTRLLVRLWMSAFGQAQ